MAEIHIKSGAANSSPFATWANAATTAAGGNAVVVAGDNVYFSPAHTETSAGVSITFAGTTSAITKLLCGVEGVTSGITALSTGAVIESNNTTFGIAGSFYAYGLTYRASSGSTVSLAFTGVSGNIQVHENCRFELTGTGPSSVVKFNVGTANGTGHCILKNPIFKFQVTGQRISVDCALTIIGGSVDTAGADVTGLFNLAPSTRACKLLVDDFNMEFCATAVDIINSIASSGTYARFRRCKLPSGWTGRLVNPSGLKAGDRFELIDYSYGTTTRKLWVEDFAGQIRDEPTVKVTANALSYKLTSYAACGLIVPLVSHEYYVPLSGAAQTLKIDIVTDNVTLTDAEICIEVDLFNAASSFLGTIVSDAVASVISTPANQTSSSTTWTTTGLTTPIRQELSVAVDAEFASYGIARVVLRKPSTTVYIDDRVQVA